MLRRIVFFAWVAPIHWCLLSIVNPFGSKERIFKTQPFISPAAKIYIYIHTAPISKLDCMGSIYYIGKTYAVGIWDPPHVRWVLIGGSCFTRLFGDALWCVFPEQTFTSNASWSQLDGIQAFDLVSRQRGTKQKPFTRFFPVTFLGGFEWPFQGVKWPPIGWSKGHLEEENWMHPNKNWGWEAPTFLQQNKTCIKHSRKKQKQRKKQHSYSPWN